MAEVAANVVDVTRPNRRNCLPIECVIISIREFRGSYEHSVALPGPDAYTPGGEALIVSRKVLGKEGEEVKLVCRVTGVKNEYEVKNGRSSEWVRSTRTFLVPADER